LIGGGKGAIETAQVGHGGEIGHLVDDHVGFCRQHGGPNGRCVEAVSDDRFRAHPFDGFRLRCRPRHAGDGMAGRNQCRHEFAANRASGARNENSHAEVPSACRPACDFRGK
jgi:hypothetical protein